MWCKWGGLMYHHGVWSGATKLLWPHLYSSLPTLNVYVVVPSCNSNPMIAPGAQPLEVPSVARNTQANE